LLLADQRYEEGMAVARTAFAVQGTEDERL
jgi:hypothetical protein